MERVAALGSRADEIANQESFALAYAGRLQQARKMSQRAAQLAIENAQGETASLWETGAALHEAFLGNSSVARQNAITALNLSRNREVEYGAALALALSGDSSRAEGLANDLERRFPEDTSVRLSYLPTLRAVLAVSQSQPAKAIDLLQIASLNELGQPRSSIHGFFGALYPIYVRGQAYLALRQGSAAAAQFQKILDHRGIVISDPIGALAHLQLARALVLSGDKMKAKSAYEDFLALWKDADHEVPILKLAKAEYARLQ
jgi:hypothetical protein